MFELAHAYRDEGMLAYSRLQQREFELERNHGYRAVKHQSFVGAGYFDAVTQIVSGGPEFAGRPERFDRTGPIHREDAGLHRSGNPSRRRRRPGAAVARAATVAEPAEEHDRHAPSEPDASEAMRDPP